MFLLAGALLLVFGIAEKSSAAEGFPQDSPSPDWDRWSFQSGVAAIMNNVIDDFPLGRFNRATGAGGGEIYLFQASYTLRDLEWEFGERTYRPQLEMPLVLGIANENDRSPFLDSNAGVTVRWKDFPWNEWLFTNFETGLGLSYTQNVYRLERLRHPGRYRSHLKFYLPIQFTFAHPRYRQHQAAFFLHHISGGRILDRGGTNALGIGYRYVFRER